MLYDGIKRVKQTQQLINSLWKFLLLLKIFELLFLKSFIKVSFISFGANLEEILNIVAIVDEKPLFCKELIKLAVICWIPPTFSFLSM